jgi:uncharacterized secreted protein with C-terminal beta-propeller domain
MSDPTNPVVAGELKILGFSNYLHPVSDDLILAIGQNATETGTANVCKYLFLTYLIFQIL